MKINELRQKSEKELIKILEDNQKKIRQFRFDLFAGKLKNIRIIRKTKKEIARILTLLKEKK